MTRQELINIAGVGSIQTLINVEISPVWPSIAIDGMFGPKTLDGLNDLIKLYLSPARQVTAEELRLPPVPEKGYWENGVDIFQQWYNAVYHKVKGQYGTVLFRKPETDGKWGEKTYMCLISLIYNCKNL